MNGEQQYIRRWVHAYVPEDRVVCIDPSIFSSHSQPVVYLTEVRNNADHDVRFIFLRSTPWSAWLRNATTMSRRACRLSFEVAGYEVITTEYGMLLKSNSFIGSWLNAVVSRIPGIRQLCQCELWLMRAKIMPQGAIAPSVSIIMPCRNEAGNVEEALRRMPTLGSFTEVICVEGHSSDGTLQELERVQHLMTHITVKVMVQSGKGKKNAVVEACTQATGDILMVFDSDMTVIPEDMRAFYDALVSRQGDLINGSRLMFPLEKGAMRFPNFIFNHIFAVLISHSGILGQNVSDTLCGTKVCWRKDYERSRVEHAWLWHLDPFGDFSWLFGSAMLGGKIKDLPVRYYARTYGQPLAGCFNYGIQLLKVLWSIGLVRIIRCASRSSSDKAKQST